MQQTGVTNGWGFLDGLVNTLGGVAGRAIDANANRSIAQSQAQAAAITDQRPVPGQAQVTATFGASNWLLIAGAVVLAVGVVWIARRA